MLEHLVEPKQICPATPKANLAVPDVEVLEVRQMSLLVSVQLSQSAELEQKAPFQEALLEHPWEWLAGRLALPLEARTYLAGKVASLLDRPIGLVQ